MAAVIQSSENTRSATAGISSLVINKPSGVVSGDVLILLVNAGTARTASCSGFTAIGHAAGTINRISSLYKVAGGSEPSTYTVNLSGTSSGIGAALLRIDGTPSPASNAIEITTNTGSGSGTATAPSVTPSDNGSLVIRVAGSQRGGSFSATPSTQVFNNTALSGAPNTGCSYESCDATPSGTASFTYTPTWHEWAAISLALAPSSTGVSVTPDPAVATASAVAPTALLGSTTATPSEASATASAIDPTPVAGSLAVAPDVASATASAVGPTVQIGGLIVTPAAAAATASAVDPTAVLGSITITAGDASATASAVDPTPIAGSVTVAPAAASAAASAIAPAVVAGSITVAPSAASAAASAVDPNPIAGSITITADAAIATASAVAPTIPGEATAATISIWLKVDCVIKMLVDDGTGGEWDDGIKAPRIKRGIAAAPLRQQLKAPELLQTDAEG